jgi:hypothetical protein
MSTIITTQYFREYRKELGFTNQGVDNGGGSWQVKDSLYIK